MEGVLVEEKEREGELVGVKDTERVMEGVRDEVGVPVGALPASVKHSNEPAGHKEKSGGYCAQEKSGKWHGPEVPGEHAGQRHV